MVCVKRDPTGKAWEVDYEMCKPFYNCAICSDDGACRYVPFSECDKTIGYSPIDHERILKWGRQQCQKR